VSVRHTEAAANNTLGTGSAGSTAQRVNTIASTYTAGPLSAKVDYSVFDNKDAVGFVGLDTRTTIGGNYDLGVVKFGLGYQKAAWTAGQSTTDTFVGATIPLGALAIGIDYLSSKLDGDSATNDKTYTGTGVQATYSLSKRTNVRFRYLSYDGSLANTDKTTGYAVALYHNF
jgi:predicted porin